MAVSLSGCTSSAGSKLRCRERVRKGFAGGSCARWGRIRLEPVCSTPLGCCPTELAPKEWEKGCRMKAVLCKKRFWASAWVVRGMQTESHLSEVCLAENGDGLHPVSGTGLRARMAESEAETPSTPGEFESKYFEYNGVRLPPFCRGKMEEIANFPVRDSDVWIVTYPKSGTGLLQEVVYLVSQGADPDEIGLMNIDEQLPVLEYPQPGLDIIKELTSPRLIKSHLPYRFLPSDLHNGNSKVIYMARNPKDLVVSYYQFHRSLRTMSYRGTFQEFCRRFMNDKLGYGSWFEHVQEFWEHHMDANMLFLKYEDMHKDLATMVEQLVRFLGVSYDKAQLESMVEHCHQLIDQCCNAEALPVGRGRVGLWKDIFTVSMNEKFDLVYKQKMGKCDLTFDFYL
ncbi:sulfotransferase 4A1 isoform X1 [Anser cygnoides]|uniref:Sulfotransferase n=2 Tax=Anser TaxID=8842 RepID=A0A8B9DJN1_ANSCY|nr:sulfotransferase 4A1 isoform X1 [Anser cygnoides]